MQRRTRSTTQLFDSGMRKNEEKTSPIKILQHEEKTLQKKQETPIQILMQQAKERLPSMKQRYGESAEAVYEELLEDGFERYSSIDELDWDVGIKTNITAA